MDLISMKNKHDLVVDDVHVLIHYNRNKVYWRVWADAEHKHELGRLYAQGSIDHEGDESYNKAVDRATEKRRELIDKRKSGEDITWKEWNFGVSKTIGDDKKISTEGLERTSSGGV